MNKEETIKEMNMIKFHLRNVSSDIRSLGRYSDSVYQAKFDRYSDQIWDVMKKISKDEWTDVRADE